MKRLKIILGVLLAAGILSVAPIAHAADNNIFPTGPVYQFSPQLLWGNGPQSFNNNYFFTPLNVNENVCVFVYNNNPTNPHTFNFSITVTGNPSEKTPSDGTWQTAAARLSATVAAFPSLPIGIGAPISGASQVALILNGSGTQAGSPDTANVVIVQTQGNCFLGNNFVGTAGAQISASIPLQAVSDGLSQAYWAQSTTTNPAANATLLSVNVNAGVRDDYFDSVIISSTVAQQININLTSTNTGTGCGAGNFGGMKVGQTTSSVSSVQTCTGAQTITLAIPVQVGAGVPTIIDLKGFIALANSTNGLNVTVPAAVVSTISVAMKWYEK